MNRNEKNMLTRQKIVDSAMLEFGSRSYGEASMNTICTSGKISKGIIYHYFKDKDELYLLCVRECFDKLTDYLSRATSLDNVPITAALQRYFDARIAFFAEHPAYLKLFYNAVISPPAHLEAAIDNISAELDAQAVSILTAMLQGVKLRENITIPEVIEVFCEYQDFVNARFQMRAAGEGTLREHEERCRRSLQIMLYGVIESEI